MSSTGALRSADLRPAPIEQFGDWLDHARASHLAEPTAMVLSTVAADGQPSSRTVLLKSISARGLTFFTNLRSRKSLELLENPRCALVFPWYSVGRQVVLLGVVEPVDRPDVEEYFGTRPRDSQLGAWTSRQSAVIANREVLDDWYAERAARFPPGVRVPAPRHWGGWLVRPRSVEFWQGRESRLHDRLRYRATVDDADLTVATHWAVERLAP